MTGSDNHGNQSEDLAGPRIRHPSGTVYPNVIFMKERHYLNKFSSAAKLYQNILEYLPRQYNPEETFKVTQMGYWLLQQNDDYRNYYTGSRAHTRASIKLENIQKRIKRYFGNLVDWDLIECVGEVESDTKNGQKTCLYRFTYVGDIIAWAVEYYNFYNGYNQLGKLENLDKLRKIKQEIFEIIKRLFSEFNSYMTDFLLGFYTKCMEFDTSNGCPFIAMVGNERKIGIGLFDQMILALVNILIADQLHFPKGIEYLSAAHTFVLTSKDTAEVALRLYLIALDEFPDTIKNIIMAHEKNMIESRFLTSQPTKD